METISVGGATIGIREENKIPIIEKQNSIDYEIWREFRLFIEKLEVPEGQDFSKWIVFDFPYSSMRDEACLIARRYQSIFKNRKGFRLKIIRIGLTELWIRTQLHKFDAKKRITLR